MSKGWAVLAIGFLAFAGCSRDVSPLRSGDHRFAFTEVESRHFVLTTNLDRSQAMSASFELEAMLDALVTVAFGSRYTPPVRVDVVHLRRFEEYAAVGGRLTRGTFFWSGRHDFERTPVAVLCGDFDESTRETLQHELMHVLTRYYVPQAPPWLDEGLAEYYATLETEDGEATIGRPSRARSYWGSYSRLPELLALGPPEFYGDSDADPESDTGYLMTLIRRAHYWSALSLVRLLHREQYRATFTDYLHALEAGQTSGEAWHRTIGRVPLEKLSADYRAEFTHSRTSVFSTNYQRPRPALGAFRTLSPAEVHLLWARLRKWNTDEERLLALTDVNDAYLHGADPVNLALVFAYWLTQNGDFDTAEQVLRRTSRERPLERRLLNALGWVTLWAAKANGKAPAHVASALEPIASALSPLAQTAAEFDLLARYRHAAGDYDGAIGYQRLAMKVDPSCVECLSHVAELWAKNGLAPEALDIAKLAVALLAEGRSSPELRQRILRYQRELAKKGSSDTGGTPPKK